MMGEKKKSSKQPLTFVPGTSVEKKKEDIVRMTKSNDEIEFVVVIMNEEERGHL